MVSEKIDVLVAAYVLKTAARCRLKKNRVTAAGEQATGLVAIKSARDNPTSPVVEGFAVFEYVLGHRRKMNDGDVKGKRPPDCTQVVRPRPWNAGKTRAGPRPPAAQKS